MTLHGLHPAGSGLWDLAGLKWLPDRKGLVNGMIVTGFGLGAFVFDFVISWYCNPENKMPTEEDADVRPLIVPSLSLPFASRSFPVRFLGPGLCCLCLACPALPLACPCPRPSCARRRCSRQHISMHQQLSSGSAMA